ncbi:hypothetical protein CTI12_AA281630 [Artemisia annua]|uniref:RecQ-mediated genome instability protein 1 n=1 Tax=Artemisia annua TaxID=35608 RepID=A0A2U1MDW6_ARTAN|nr:hypothetical protein CTI12_AA281630 [Artemisia annua]
MENNNNNHFSKSLIPADDHRFEFELYTVPSRAGWFSWDNIHDIERAALTPFFDGSSFTRNPRVYKEYRDHIINKFREYPSRRLTFSEGGGVGMGESEFKIGMGPLGSYTDVFQEVMELVCESCKGRCESGHYESTKDANSIICSKCFKNGSYGKNKSIDDYKFVDSTPDNGNHVTTWTEAETFLLLQSVTKHGDDWDLVAQNDSNNSINNQKQEQGGPPVPQEAKDIEVQNVELESKTQQNGDVDSETPPAKRICIAPVSDSSDTKMEQVTALCFQPFDKLDVMNAFLVLNQFISLQTDNQDEQVAPSEETKEIDGEICELKHQKQQDGDLENHCPLKTDRSKPLPIVSNSLMQQITRISAVVGPQVAASAAEAAVTALCEENEIPKEIFDTEENGNELPFSTQTNEHERVAQGNDIEMDARPSESEKDVIPLPLRMRATSATILGAAAAHAKLLAIQEDKEVERLVSTVVSTQLKKLQHKMKLLNEAESIMEKEFAQMTELEDSLLTERVDVIEKGIDAGFVKALPIDLLASMNHGVFRITFFFSDLVAAFKALKLWSGEAFAESLLFSFPQNTSPILREPAANSKRSSAANIIPSVLKREAFCVCCLVSGNPIGKVLEELGLRLRGEWLDACLRGLESGVAGFSGLGDTKKAKMCFERFLECDMNLCGAGLLPSNVGRMHLVDLPGPFVLQVDEIVNISQPLRQRYKTANAGFHRCLKLSMTDGVQRVFGMEYQPIKDLDALAPAGLKVAISNVNVRHGLLMLVPEVIQVLGGLVEELDAARQRLVEEVNKPPRGRRTRSGVVPPLATRATRAAWPAEDINVPRPLNNPVPQTATPIQVDDQGARAARPTDGIHVSRPINNPVPQRATPIQVADQGIRAARSTGGIHGSRPLNNDQQRETPMQVDGPAGAAWPTDDNHVSRLSNNNPQRGTPIHVDGQGTHATWPTDDIHVSQPSNNNQQRATVIEVDSPGTPATWPTDDIHVSRPLNNPVSHMATPMQVDDHGTTPASVNERVSSRTEVESSFSTRRENIEPLPSMATTESSVYMDTENASFAVPIPSESVKTTPLRVTEEASILIQRPSPVAISDDEDVHMVAAEDNHIASGRSNESPFMYLATLSAKWAETKDQVANVEGKIKCFVTGVKKFQYKERSTYKLHVYVDDGSLISEILIDHSIHRGNLR